MILRKPYALFIKLFKPIHIIIAGLLGTLMFRTSAILKFLSNYIYTETSTVGTEIVKEYSSSFLYYFPTIMIIISLVFFGVMFTKKKPYKFYIFEAFAFLIILVLNVYILNFLETMEFHIVSVTTAKVIHDICFICIIIEVISYLLFISRGLGLNFKKFDFSSDLFKMDISESDREEVEVSINVDIDEQLRKRKERLRRFRYFFYEHKFYVITISSIIIFLVYAFGYYFVNIQGRTNKEGRVYTENSFNIRVNRSYILNSDYKDNKITDNYLVVIDFSVNSVYEKELYLKDFNLKIGEARFKPIYNYEEELMDLGVVFNDNIINIFDTSYLLVFEVSEKYINTEMILNYLDLPIRLKPNKERQEEVISSSFGNALSFEKTLGNINFTIKNYEIVPSVVNEYDYCVKGDCIYSKEYLKPSISENYDKVLLKLDVDYKNESTYQLNNFYEFFNTFGSIEYVKSGETYYQYDGFEIIESTKVNDKNIYIGINKAIMAADGIKIVFNIRGVKYEYILR